MPRLLTAVLLALSVAATGADSQSTGARATSDVATGAAPLAFTHVTVIDVTGGPSQTDMTVVIAGNQAATVNPARFLNATDSLGTVAPGKLADLVLLDANPLVDIGNTRRIRAVVVNGRLLDRTALDAMLRPAPVEAPKE